MGIAISSREDKAETVDLLRRLVLRFIFPGVLNLETREAILNHLNWIKAQPGLVVNAELQTIPELQSTKITFMVSHMPQGPVKHDA